MKKIFVFLGLILHLIICANYAIAQDLPKVIPPSPEAAALFRFQDYPMDYSTGLPQISIPLYEVKSGSLSVPISISYHAAGRRIDDQDGAVGLGWSLNAGGMISRTIHGDVDFGTSLALFPFPNSFNTNSINNFDDIIYLENLAHWDKNQLDGVSRGSWLDGEYDVFSYSFGGNGGKFIFADNAGTKTPVLLPYKPYIITPTTDATGLKSIEILDDKGVLYTFSAKELGGEGNYAATSWSLTKITSADKTDVITFVYTSAFQYRYTYNRQTVKIDEDGLEYRLTGDETLTPPHVNREDHPEYTSLDGYSIQRLSEIDFNQGKIVFHQVGGTDNNNKYKIDYIQVLNSNDQLIKTIQFNRSLFDQYIQGGVTFDHIGTPQKNNVLSSLEFKGTSGAVVETYTFQYNPTDGTIDPHYADWWGYYNNSGTLEMVPRYLEIPSKDYATLTFSYPDIGSPSTNREPNLQALKSGMLSKIIYPTGGSTEFTYEFNHYLSPGGQDKIGPGLRIAQLKTNDNNGAISIKTYKYGLNENGVGALDAEPQLAYMTTEKINQYYQVGSSDGDITGGYDRERTFYSDFIPQLSELAARPVIYKTVTEYIGTIDNNVGRTIYTFDYNHPWGAANYPALMDGHNVPPTFTKYHISYYNYWDNPSLINKQEDKNNGSTTTGTDYKTKRITSYGFTIVPFSDIKGVHIARLYDFPQDGELTGGNTSGHAMYPEPFGVKEGHINAYTYGEYVIATGSKNLTSTTETIYNDDGSQTTSITNNTYNAKQYVSQTLVSTSDANSKIQTQIKYPFDYTGNAVLTQMVSPSVNMLAYPVEQIQNKVIVTPSSTLPLSSVRTNYFDYGSTTPAIYPQTVDVKKGSNSYETRLRYYSYDATGNPLGVTKEKDARISYIWDYNKTYPIAEIKNASIADIAFTSFEADGTGYWSGINASNVITDAIHSATGGKYYNFSGTTLTKSGLSSTKNYIVSYWSKNGQYSVSGTTVSGWPKTLRSVTLNGVTWTNFEHNVTGVTSDGVTSITVSGTGAIDELRLYPETAQMTSYTYTPLIGITTQSDANNRITYYEYDPFNRLKLIRDMDWNIIKTFTYQYKSSTY